MKDNLYTIQENKMLSPGTYHMRLAGDTSEITAPGQFINIKLDGHYLRRPMSICDYDDDGLTLIYRVVGEGTREMSKMNPGESLIALAPLGNGFDISDIPDEVTLVGGGAGAMPMYSLVKKLLARESATEINVVLGFNSEDDMFFYDEFANLGVNVVVTTLDGAFGVKGTVVDGMKSISEENLPYVCACGPDPMLKAVYENAEDGQYDLSARMACGFGACMGCTIETKAGPARVCKEGPIFKQENILF